MVCVAFAALVWLGKQKEFPYTGTLMNDDTRPDGTKYRTVLVISKDKGCSLHVTGKAMQQLGCTYVMTGRSAVLNCQIAVPRQVWTRLEIQCRITPEAGGQKIFFETLKTVLIDERTGKRQEGPGTNKIMLHKVAAT
jgi:hypothetical protein